MKVALTCCILSLAFLVIFSAESAGKKESLQNVHNKRAVSHKGKKNKRFKNKEGRTGCVGVGAGGGHLRAGVGHAHSGKDAATDRK